MILKNFDFWFPCRKCGLQQKPGTADDAILNEITIEYEYDFDRIIRKCKRCGYEWIEAPLHSH